MDLFKKDSKSYATSPQNKHLHEPNTFYKIPGSSELSTND